MPVNPWGNPPTATVIACVGAATGCSRVDATGCGGAAFTQGWCYNVGSGEIWPDSRNNGTAPFEEAY